MTNVGGNKVPEITGAEHISPEHTGDNISAKRVANYGFDGSNWQRLAVNPDGSISTSPGDYAIKVTTSGTTTYVGRAAVGSAQSSAVWQAQKIDESSGTVVTWADGNANFDNVATDLTSLSYS